MGSRRTPAANATLLGNMVIVYMPFYLFGLLGERINRGELAGTFLAAAGMVVLGVSDAHISLQRLGGDAIIFLSSQLVCVYLVLARRNGDFPSIWLYVVPMYAMAALVSFVAALPWRLPWQVGSTENLLYLLGLGLGPTVIGHSVLNYSFKHMRGQLVSLLCLAEFVFATLLAWPIFGEVPRWPFYLAGGMLVCGAAVAILTSGRKAAPEPVEEAV
jgi:drug/metabolite transporter (DMT)-like permease